MNRPNRRKRIVILGGAVAGPTAAARARELDESAEITLLERGTHVAYAPLGIPYALSGEAADLSDLTPSFFEKHFAVGVRTGTEAVAIDPQRRVVATQESGEVPYDVLIFALGATSRLPEGLAGENVRSLRSLSDLDWAREELQGQRKKVLVLGGGPAGIEIAEGLVRAGAAVKLVERGPDLLPHWGLQARAAARKALTGHCKLILDASVRSAEKKGDRVEKVVLSNGVSLDVDFVVVAVGLFPRTQLLAQAGAEIAADGTIVVNGRCETSLPGVYACGGCVSVPQIVTGRPVWAPQGSIGDKSAQVAGENAGGGDARLDPALGSMLLRVFETHLGRTGLGWEDAERHLGRDFRTTSVHAFSHDSFMPGVAPLHIQLFWDYSSGRVLGVEVEGSHGVDKRIDTAAASITGGLTVEDLSLLDLGYAPPFSSARDPLNVAGNVARAEWKGRVATISPRKLHERMKTDPAAFFLLDVRAGGHGGPDRLPGSVSIPLDDLRARLGELPKDRAIVVFDNKGRDGHLATRILVQNGFDARNLSGGLVSWLLVDLPTERE